jgi:hypothetical protein
VEGLAWVVTLLGIAVAPALLVAQNTVARLHVVVFGALLVFQSSDSLDAPKFLYIGVLAIALTVTLKDPSNNLKRLSLAVAALLMLLCVAAIARGRDPLWVIRDASNYILLAAAAPLAVNFGLRLNEVSVRRVTVAAAGFGVYAFTAQWTSNRGLADLPTPGVPSSAMFTLAIAGASAMAVSS